MAKLSGTAAVLAEAVREAGPVARAPRQSRLPLAEPDLLAVEIERSPFGASERARKRGRPKGSRNRRSEELIRYLLQRYAHPAEILASIASRPVELLAREIGCSKGEALDRQIRAAAELMPYFESKKPVSLQVEARAYALTINLGEPVPLAEDKGDAVTISGEIAPARHISRHTGTDDAAESEADQ